MANSVDFDMDRSLLICLLLMIAAVSLISHDLSCGLESPQACSSLHCLFSSSLSGESTTSDFDLRAENSVLLADIPVSLPAAVKDIFHPPRG